jgi:hypothetical protein
MFNFKFKNLKFFSKSLKNLPSMIYPQNDFVPKVCIDRDINFNNNGLYLVAEYKKKSFLNKFSINTYLWIFISSVLIPSYTLYFIINFPIFTILMLQYFNKNPLKYKENLIKKIYLSDDLEHVLLVFNGNNIDIFDTKNFSLCNEFEKHQNIYDFPIFNYKFNAFIFIPYGIQIYDREIFSAIFRGYHIKLRDPESEKKKYIKLNL